MVEHYYSEAPSSQHKEAVFSQILRGREFRFTTDAGVFSKDKVDTGTKLLVESVALNGNEKVLDWGCGYGPIGISISASLTSGSVIMVDINSRAVELALRNISNNGARNCSVRQGDGFEVVLEDDFDVVISNPPIRAGKKVIYAMVDEAVNHLKIGGRIILVAKTSQGAKSLEKKVADVFGNVSELEKGSGFRVIQGVKE